MLNRLLILLTVIFIGCESQHEKPAISHRTDYVAYLKEQTFHKASLDETEAFWENKIAQQPNGYIYIQKLAALKAGEFEKTGDVTVLKVSDSLYQLAAKMLAGKRKASNYIALSSNAVTQHEFKNALDYANQAMELMPEKFGPSLMVFDAAMELGLYDLADRMLRDTKNMESFDYLVRLSKYLDHKGNLDSAITIMEKAYKMVARSDNPTALWAQTFLADMYSHNGNVEKAYRYYLEVLAKNPRYLHALKSIAWVAFSHDNKTDEAWEIYEYLSRQKPLPDYHLLLAQIAEYSKDTAMKTMHERLFIKEATKPKYKNMYNKYLATLYTEEFKDYNKAINIANKEVHNRPTPMTYGLLAWAYENKGDHKKALEIVKSQIEGKSFEPDLLYKMGMIYASNNLNLKAEKYLSEAAQSSYELGPMKSHKIEHLLASI